MKKMMLIVACLFLLGSMVPVSSADPTDMEMKFSAFLEEYEAKVIPLSITSSLAYFTAVVTGNDADYAKAAQAEIALTKIYSDTEIFAQLKTFHESAQVIDPGLRRQLEVIYLRHLEHQVDPLLLEELVNRENNIEQKFNTYRVTIGDRQLSDNQVDSILRYATDAEELRQTWLASKQIGREVAPEILELVKLRNRIAQSLGFADYFEMQLKLDEQNPAEIVSLFAELDSLTRDTFTALKAQIDSALAARHGIAIGQLQPWHYQNRFFQEAPRIYPVDLDRFFEGKDPVALSREYFAAIGLPVDSILARSDLYERPGKYQHAQCVSIDNAGDVRVICNVRRDNYWMATMLHELGHAVYDYYYDPQAPWLLRGAAHSLTTEAVAEFFGRLSANPQWLVQVAGVPQAESDRAAEDCVRMQRLEQIVFSRWSQVMLHFEKALYENPDRDLNTLWWDLVEKYQGLTRPEGRHEPDWAAKIHLATSTAYYHNYILGELLASQFIETIGRKILNSTEPFQEGFAGKTQIGKYFVENVFYPGNRYSWNEMIERATGEKLTSRYFARQFIGMK
jgi:peptidyl-dipeptidase A